jgi:endonuclease YncB( thermonuclease family)
MRLARIVFLLLGIGAAVLVGWVIFAREDARVTKQEAIFTKPLSTSPPKPDAPEAAPVESSREVTGASTDESKQTPPGREKAEAKRQAAVEQKAVTMPVKPNTKIHYRVTVRDGGTLESSGVVITLDGIVAQKADATCSASGKTWACGAAARVALTRLIRARAVSCTQVGKSKDGLTARCRVGDTDLSTWLVRQGWARPKEPAEKTLAEAAKAAQAERIGVWRPAE